MSLLFEGVLGRKFRAPRAAVMARARTAAEATAFRTVIVSRENSNSI